MYGDQNMPRRTDWSVTFSRCNILLFHLHVILVWVAAVKLLLLLLFLSITHVYAMSEKVCTVFRCCWSCQEQRVWYDWEIVKNADNATSSANQLMEELPPLDSMATMDLTGIVITWLFIVILPPPLSSHPLRSLSICSPSLCSSVLAHLLTWCCSAAAPKITPSGRETRGHPSEFQTPVFSRSSGLVPSQHFCPCH